MLRYNTSVSVLPECCATPAEAADSLCSWVLTDLRRRSPAASRRSPGRYPWGLPRRRSPCRIWRGSSRSRTVGTVPPKTPDVTLTVSWWLSNNNKEQGFMASAVSAATHAGLRSSCFGLCIIMTETRVEGSAVTSGLCCVWYFSTVDL